MPTGRKYVSAIKAMDGYVLHVDFVSGGCLLLDMKPYLDKIRFRSLADPQIWNDAVTNGIFIHFDDVELSRDEVLSMAEREYNSLDSMKRAEGESEYGKLEKVYKSFAGAGSAPKHDHLREKRQQRGRCHQRRRDWL